jgi:hypothetical protein
MKKMLLALTLLATIAFGQITPYPTPGGSGSGSVTSSGTPVVHALPIWTTATNLIGLAVAASDTLLQGNAAADPGWVAIGNCVSNGGALQYATATHTFSCHTLASADIPNNAADTTGNAATATALAVNPTDCGAGTYAVSIDASGNLTCTAPSTLGYVLGGSSLTGSGALLKDSGAGTAALSSSTCGVTKLASGVVSCSAVADLPGSAYPTVTDASPVAWNLGSSFTTNGHLTLAHGTATRALNISNPVTGGFYTLIVEQDSTGGAAMTLGSGCTWKLVNGGAGAIVLSSAANSIDILVFTYDGTNCYTSVRSNFN